MTVRHTVSYLLVFCCISFSYMGGNGVALLATLTVGSWNRLSACSKIGVC